MNIRKLLFFTPSLILMLILQCFSTVYAKPQPVSMAVLVVNQQQINAFEELINRFNSSQSELVVNIDFFSDQGLKSKISSWLESGEYDLIHWQAGERLQRIVKQELVRPIDSIISKDILSKNINAQVLETVNVNDSLQALPFAYYPWGFYFNKALFEQYSLTPPNSWDEFLELSNQLKSQGVAPLVQANQESWPMLAWIDYLSLDIGGIKTRTEMAEYATASRADVLKITDKFSTLLKGGYFFSPTNSWRWEQTINLVLRKRAAMTLVGQFAESEISPEHSSKIGFFPFPFSSADKRYPEVAPIDLFVVPLASKNHQNLPAFLEFIVQQEANNILAKGLGYLPIHPQYNGDGISERAAIGLERLRSSSAIVQFFDRDAEKEHATNIANGIANSMVNGEASLLKEVLLGEELAKPSEQIVNFGIPENLLEFSSFTGSVGTFFASNILSAVYEKLGYNISVTRYQNMTETINAIKFGADGELLRAAVFGDLTSDLIKVPESIVEISFYLVCRARDACARKLQPNVKIGASMELLVINDWWIEEEAVKQEFTSTSAMLKAYKSGQIDYMILAETDVAANREQLTTSGFRTIIKVPFYHFIHKKHQKMLDRVNLTIKTLKQSPEYQNLLQHFGIK